MRSGTYSPSGSTRLASCLTCASGYFSVEAAASCTWCATLGPGYLALSSNNVPMRWAGGPLQYQCTCQVGYTGDDCEYNRCSDNLRGSSLGAMLFLSDTQMRLYSQNYNSSNPDQLRATYAYVATLLKTSVDMNGDGNITVAEMKNALIYRSVWSSGMIHLPLWCRSASRPLSAYCYQDRNPEMIETQQIFVDAMQNFITSPKHTFDGSSIPLITSLSSTYPNPKWSDEHCKAHNSRWFPKTYKHVMTAWNWTNKAVAMKSITRVCGYSNGLFVPGFVKTSVLSGSQTSFRDYNNVTATNLYKRIYCISVDYSEQMSYECSVGLFYVSIS